MNCNTTKGINCTSESFPVCSNKLCDIQIQIGVQCLNSQKRSTVCICCTGLCFALLSRDIHKHISIYRYNLYFLCSVIYAYNKHSITLITYSHFGISGIETKESDICVVVHILISAAVDHKILFAEVCYISQSPLITSLNYNDCSNQPHNKYKLNEKCDYPSGKMFSLICLYTVIMSLLIIGICILFFFLFICFLSHNVPQNIISSSTDKPLF